MCKRLNIVTFVTADYQWLLKPFCLLLDKYWPEQHVICFGNENGGLPQGVEFRKFSGDFVENFGHGVSEALKTLEDDVFILTLADMWLRREVKEDSILSLAEYMRGNLGRIARIGIGTDTGSKVKANLMDTVDSMEVYRISVSDPHIGMRSGLLLWPSLWNRQLVQGLIRDCTLWDFEILHNEKMMTESSIGCWVDNGIYCYVHTFFRHTRDRIRSMRYFSAEDRELIKNNIPEGILIEA